MSYIAPFVCLILLILTFRTRAGSICQQEYDAFGLVWLYLQTVLGLLITLMIGCIYVANVYFSRAARQNVRSENTRKQHFLKLGSMVLRLGKSKQGIDLLAQPLHDAFQALTQVQKESVLPTLVSVAQQHLSWRLDHAHVRTLAESESTCFSCGEAFQANKWLTFNPSGSRKFHHDCVLPLVQTAEGCSSFFEEIEASYILLREMILKKYEMVAPPPSIFSNNSSSSSSSSGSASSNSRHSKSDNLTSSEMMDEPKRPGFNMKGNKVSPSSKSYRICNPEETVRTNYQQPI